MSLCSGPTREPAPPRRKMTNIALLRHRKGGSRKDPKRREALRAAFIYQEQRNPVNREQLVFPPATPRLGPLSRPLQRHLVENTSRSAFRLEQQLWTHLAGKRTRYWHLGDGHKKQQPEEPLYVPLDGDKREIRVLKVSRVSKTTSNDNDDENHNNDNNTFKANLLRVSLDDDPAYIAISYTWGDPSIVGQFETDQEGAAGLEYNRAVLEIVSTLVPKASSLYLWIDSICINQRNKTEKASQVALMGEVFKRARQVVISLGQPDVDTTIAMDLLQRVNATDPFAKQYLPAHRSEDRIKFENDSIRAGIPLWAWSSVRRLLYKRWFTRYWVIQEAALGVRSVVFCGRHTVQWSRIIYVCRLMLEYRGMFPWAIRDVPRKMGDGVQEFPLRITNLSAIFQIHQRTRSNYGLGLNLSDLMRLGAFGVFQAKDQRDRIFAVMGLAWEADREEPDFQPNYEIKVEDLFTQVACRFLTRMGKEMEKLHIIYAAGVGYPRWLQLPSWVPDWTPLGSRSYLFAKAKRPDPDSIAYTELRVAFDPGSPRVAILHGYIIDSVSSLSHDRNNPGGRFAFDHLDTRERLWLDSILELIISTHPAAQTTTSDANALDLTTYDTLTGSPRWKYCLWKTLIASNPDIGFSERFVISNSTLDLYFHTWGYWYARSDVEDEDNPAKPLDDPVPTWEAQQISKYIRAYCRATSQRKFMISSKGYFGLTSPGTHEGDLVCVFSGMITPIIVRPVASQSLDPCYVLVGEAYHYGIMEGELPIELDLMHPIRLV